MVKNGSSAIEERDALAEEADDGFKSLLERGRSAVERLPDAVDDARSALDAAEGQLAGLSDRGVIAAVGFSAGISTGLFLAGAPRLILAASIVPVLITVRTALARGVWVSRLVN